MQPQLRVRSDHQRQYYFQFLSGDNRLIFESIPFANKPSCAKGINELRSLRCLEEYISKIEHDGCFSFIITNKKKLFLGSGKRYWTCITRNVDIRLLAQELPRAVIFEDDWQLA